MVTEQLERVALSLGQSIVYFWQNKMNAPGRRFTATELRQYVQKHNFGTAPASADRVLRHLRKAGKLNYAVVNRRASLYEALPLADSNG
jgi:hypothetical protein